MNATSSCRQPNVRASGCCFIHRIIIQPVQRVYEKKKVPPHIHVLRLPMQQPS